jgi:hypothetical protein
MIKSLASGSLHSTSNSTAKTSAKPASVELPTFEIDIDELTMPSMLELIEDEDMEEECDAAMSSPIKGRQRLTTVVHSSALALPLQISLFSLCQGMVKIKQADEEPVVENKVSCSWGYKNSDLPGCLDQNWW